MVRAHYWANTLEQHTIERDACSPTHHRLALPPFVACISIISVLAAAPGTTTTLAPSPSPSPSPQDQVTVHAHVFWTDTLGQHISERCLLTHSPLVAPPLWRVLLSSLFRRWHREPQQYWRHRHCHRHHCHHHGSRFWYVHGASALEEHIVEHNVCALTHTWLGSSLQA